MAAKPLRRIGSKGPGGVDGLTGESHPASDCWRRSEPADRRTVRGLGSASSAQTAPWDGAPGDPGMNVGTSVSPPLRPRRTGPSQFLLRLADDWGLSQEDLVSVLGFTPASAAHVASVLGGWAEFRGRDVRDRIVHLYRIRETLDSLLRDLEVEREWLQEPHDLLGGSSPMSLLLGGSMEELLLVREYVDEFGGI